MREEPTDGVQVFKLSDRPGSKILKAFKHIIIVIFYTLCLTMDDEYAVDVEKYDIQYMDDILIVYYKGQMLIFRIDFSLQ